MSARGAARSTRLGVRRRLTAILGLLGLTLLALGLWIPAKAALAQVLIARAWAAHLAEPTGSAPPPWPWADTVPIARLDLGGEREALYVLAGASGQSLAFGPAHVSTSARPGEADHVAIAGHRDTHFSALRDLAPGDRVRLEVRDGATDYEVVGSEVVHASRTDRLGRRGHPELTLVTCYPFDALVPGGPWRYLVHARAVGSAPPARIAQSR